MATIIENISNFLYTYILIFLLIAAGLYFTFKTKFVQLTMLKDGIKSLINEKRGGDGVSSFQSLMISIASRVGTGNIAGVSVAISIGGPGSVFWMWVIALIGGASAFVESTLAQIYKEKDGDSFRGGPSYYMQKALKRRYLGIIFAILVILCFAFGFNALQSFNIASSLESFFPNPQAPVYIGVVFAILTGLIIFGGIHRIGIISSILVPIMAVIYIFLGIVVIIKHITFLPGVIQDIFTQAMGIGPMVAGGLGAVVMQGVKRGLFSNEAGMGSSPNAAACANVSHPVKQGLAQVISVFIDTLVICSTTAIFVLLTNPDPSLKGIAIVQNAFLQEFGQIGIYFITIAIILFAFTSIIGNYTYAESNFKFIFGENYRLLTCFRILCLFPVMLGTLNNLDLAWNIADILMGLMAIVNIFTILLLTKTCVICLNDYKAQKKAGKDPQFHPKELGIKGTEAWD